MHFFVYYFILFYFLLYLSQVDFSTMEIFYVINVFTFFFLAHVFTLLYFLDCYPFLNDLCSNGRCGWGLS